MSKYYRFGYVRRVFNQLGCGEVHCGPLSQFAREGLLEEGLAEGVDVLKLLAILAI